MVDKIIERNKFSLTKANFIALWDDRLLKRSWVTTTKYNPSGRNGCLSLRSLVNYICSCSIKTRLLKILGFASMRITVVLFMQATREKVTPLVILKCKDSEIEKKYGKFGGLPNQSLGKSISLKRWLQLVFPSVFDTSGNILVWDSCWAHIVQDIKKTNGIISAVITGG